MYAKHIGKVRRTSTRCTMNIKNLKSMSQKFIKKKVTSPKQLGYGKYYAKAVYNKKHIGTDQLADFIQTQASVKKSDCIAVLSEAMPCAISSDWARK